MPDIDLDFARDIREQLILRVYERYGHDHAALVCTLRDLPPASAVRDLGKVLGLPPAAIDKLAQLSEGGIAEHGAPGAGPAARVSGPGRRAALGAPGRAGRADRRASRATSASTSAG